MKRFALCFRLFSLLGATMLFVAALAGCAMIDQWRGEGFKDDMATTGSKLRPPADSHSEPSLFSAKSEQVEHDLGY